MAKNSEKYCAFCGDDLSCPICLAEKRELSELIDLAMIESEAREESELEKNI